MGAHENVATLFFVAWGSYLIAEAARLAAFAEVYCDYYDDLDSKYMENLCHGDQAAAVLTCIGAVLAFAAAGLQKFKQELAPVAFFLSLSIYAASAAAETAGNSAASCHKDAKVFEDNTGTYCDGYAAGAVFFSFAFVTAFIMAGLYHTRKSEMQITVAGFFAFLALFAAGMLSEFALAADITCDEDDDLNESYCSGFGFASFILVVAIVAAIALAGVSFVKQNTGSYVWGGFLCWFGLVLLAYAARYASEANVYCEELSDVDDDTLQSNEETYCSAYSAATLFSLLGVFTALLGGVCVFLEKEAFKHALLLMTWACLYLSFTSEAGGFASVGCDNLDDADDAIADIEEDSLEAQCNGFTAATIFFVVAGVLVFVSALITQISIGAPVDDKQTNTGSKEQTAQG